MNNVATLDDEIVATYKELSPHRQARFVELVLLLLARQIEVDPAGQEEPPPTA